MMGLSRVGVEGRVDWSAAFGAWSGPGSRACHVQSSQLTR
jgi:hypothetical protein